MRVITKIIVHCTATPEGRHHNIYDVKRWHLERGFSDVGYHYLILLDGTIEPGREERTPGAHCVGRNADSIGIAYVGGCDNNMQPKDTRTIEQRRSLTFLLHTLRQKYPHAIIYGHRDFDKGKACPSFDARNEYLNL